MARLLWLAAQLKKRGPTSGLAPVWLAWTLAGLILPWTLAPPGATTTGHGLPAMVAALWPLALGLTLASLAAHLGLRLPAVPPGDLIVPVERLIRVWARFRESPHALG